MPIQNQKSRYSNAISPPKVPQISDQPAIPRFQLRQNPQQPVRPHGFGRRGSGRIHQRRNLWCRPRRQLGRLWRDNTHPTAQNLPHPARCWSVASPAPNHRRAPKHRGHAPPSPRTSLPRQTRRWVPAPTRYRPGTSSDKLCGRNHADCRIRGSRERPAPKGDR